MRLIDADALKEKVNAFYDELFVGCVSSDLITYASGVDGIIDNAPTVAVNCKDCDGYEAGYSAGLKDAERTQVFDNCDMNVFEPEKYMKGGAEE